MRPAGWTVGLTPCAHVPRSWIIFPFPPPHPPCLLVLPRADIMCITFIWIWIYVGPPRLSTRNLLLNSICCIFLVSLSSCYLTGFDLIWGCLETNDKSTALCGDVAICFQRGRRSELNFNWIWSAMNIRRLMNSMSPGDNMKRWHKFMNLCGLLTRRCVPWKWIFKKK